MALAVVADGSERLGGGAGIEADRFRFETPILAGPPVVRPQTAPGTKPSSARDGKTITLDREG